MLYTVFFTQIMFSVDSLDLGHGPRTQWAGSLFMTKYKKNEIFVVLNLQYIQVYVLNTIYQKNRFYHCV